MARTSKTPEAPVIKILSQDDLLTLTQAFHDRLDLIAAQQKEILDRLDAQATPLRHRRQTLRPTRP